MFLDEISEQRRDHLIDWLAFRVLKYQMETAAVAMLETIKPLSFLGSQAIHFVAPAADLLFGHPYASEAGFLLQDRANIERLIGRIEELMKLQKKGVNIWEMDPRTISPTSPGRGGQDPGSKGDGDSKDD